MEEIKLSNLYKHADIFYDCLLNTPGRVGKLRSGTDLAKDFKTVWETGKKKMIVIWLVKYFEDINSTTCLSYDDNEADTIITILKNPENHKSVVDSVLATWGGFERYWERSLEGYFTEQQVNKFENIITRKNSVFTNNLDIDWNTYCSYYNLYSGKVQDSYYSDLDADAHYAGATMISKTEMLSLKPKNLSNDKWSVICNSLLEDYRHYFIGDIDSGSNLQLQYDGDDLEENYGDNDKLDVEEFLQDEDVDGIIFADTNMLSINGRQAKAIQTVNIESSDLLIGLNNKINISAYNGIISSIISANEENYGDEDCEDFEVDFVSLDKDIVEIYNQFFQTLNIPGVISMKAVSISRPTSYNYANDTVNIDIEVESDIIKPNMEIAFAKYLKETNKSYDGFLNFMPENIEEYNEKCISDPERAYSSAVAFLIQNNDCEILFDNLCGLIENDYLR